MRRPKCLCKIHGFSLVQLSALVLAGGLVAAAMLPEGEGQSQASRYITTMKHMKKIEAATLRHMMAKESRRPCPASGEYYPGNAKFGIEDGTAGDCVDSGSTDGLLTPFDDTNVVAGTVPVNDLHLPVEYYFDGWGRPFTYVVDKRATKATDCVQMTGTGDVEIYPTDAGTIKEKTMVALISHGPDGHGSFQPGGSTAANRLDAGGSDQDQHNNAGASGATVDPPNFNPATFANEWVKKEMTSTYDDIVWYSERFKNRCCVGKSCSKTLAAIAAAAAESCPNDVGSIPSDNDYADFDGTDDYVALGNVNDITGDEITLSAWVSSTAPGSGNRYIIAKSLGTGATGYAMNATSSTVRFFIGDGAYIGKVASHTWDGNWTHVVGRYDGTDLRVFINGVDQGTPAANTGNIATNTNDLNIGTFSYSPATYAFNGKIKDVRIYDDALTADEITYLYSKGSSGTDPGTTNLQGHWKLNETHGTTVRDYSVSANDGTATSITASTFWKPFRYADFDGTDDHVLTSITSSETVYSISAWVNIDDWTVANSYRHVVSKGNVFHTGDFEFAAGIRTNPIASNRKFTIHSKDGGTLNSSGTAGNMDSSYPAGEWAHVVWIWSNGNQKIYANGTQVATNTVAADPGSSGNVIRIGGPDATDSTSRYFDGKIRDVRIYNDILTTNEIDYLHTKGATGTDPTSDNLIAFYKIDNASGTAVLDYSTNCNNGTATNITEPGFWLEN